MNITIKHKLSCTNDEKIKFKKFKRGGRDHYKIIIWIDANSQELDNVASVEYLLHSSFTIPRRIARNRNSNFAISIWTWGIFEIEVTVKTILGDQTKLTHMIDYELPDNDSDYFDMSK